jgi:hypothetical protein
MPGRAARAVGALVVGLLAACAPEPDPLTGTWVCQDGLGSRVVEGLAMPCPVEGKSWELTVPEPDGTGSFAEITSTIPAGSVVEPALALPMEPGAWQIDVPTWRCPTCATTGEQDGLALTCLHRELDGERFAHCGGVDGGGFGWELRLVGPLQGG